MLICLAHRYLQVLCLLIGLIPLSLCHLVLISSSLYYMSLLRSSLSLPTVLKSFMSIFLTIAWNSSRQLTFILFSSFSVGGGQEHILLFLHFHVCFYVLGISTTSPGLENVTYMEGVQWGPVVQYPLVTRTRCSKSVRCVD